MQKKLIALAVAGLVSGAAFAQSNVTVYGVAGAYLQQLNTESTTAGVRTDAKVNQVQTDGESGSRIGFRGTEDLGGGLKANFTIESAIAMDTAGNAAASGQIGLGNRQAFVGLSGNFGAVTMGRQYSAEFWHMAAKSDIWGYADWSALLGSGMAATTRVNNSIKYTSPSMSGFSAGLLYGFSEVAVAPKDTGKYMGLNLDYANGPVWVGLGHQTLNVDTLAANGNNTWTSLGASYNFGMATVSGNYQTRKAGLTGAKENAYQLGVNFKIGANGAIIGQYANRNDKSATDLDSKAWALGYQHLLSKRTNLVIGASNVDQQSSAAVLPTLLDTRKYYAGVRHTF